MVIVAGFEENYQILIETDSFELISTSFNDDLESRRVLNASIIGALHEQTLGNFSYDLRIELEQKRHKEMS